MRGEECLWENSMPRCALSFFLNRDVKTDQRAHKISSHASDSEGVDVVLMELDHLDRKSVV